MPATIVVGTQWGDEGKGKFTDLFAKEMSMVVRYQGGHNAGHTLVVNGESFALQLVPSGVLYDHIIPVIGNGVVVDPIVLLAEIDMLTAKGVDCSRLAVSGNAHLILPYHQEIDALTERYLGKNKLGTTKRGIGPAYADKSTRVGIRVQDLLDPKIFQKKLEAVLDDRNQVLTRVYNRLPFEADELAEKYLGEVRDRMMPYVADTVGMVHEARGAGQRVLFEGAQGTTSITAPTRLSRRRRPPPAVSAREQAWGPATSIVWSVSPRPTSPVWGPDRSPPNCSTRSATTWWTSDMSTAPTPVVVDDPGGLMR